MKPFPIGPDTPTSLAAFNIRWPALVTKVRTLSEDDHPYLAAIARYSNNGGVPDGIFALELELASDPEADRLLGLVHHLTILQQLAPAALLSRTAAAAALERFAESAEALGAWVEEARFEYLSPLLLEGTMAQDLFLYGMYQFFYEEHSAGEARALTREFLANTVGDELEDIVPLTTRAAWGHWFDPHSCSDRTWLLVSRRARRAWLLAFSHSD
jgi:hypothetical protein